MNVAAASQTIAARLAEYAVGLKYEQIPKDVVHRAKCFFLDSIGCAVGGFGSNSEPIQIITEFASRTTSTPPATVLCSGMKTSLDFAVLLNSALVRYLDFNDAYTSSTSGHPSDNIAALLSVAEVSGASGRDLIVAIVIAYEVNCRLSDGMDAYASCIDNPTLGAVATAAAAAQMLGLTRAQAYEAINLALVSNVTLVQTRYGDVSMWKGCAHANACRNAVFAAQLAARGMTGPSLSFEGKGGFLKLIRQELRLPSFGGEDADSSFKIMESSVKRYPLGMFSQSVVQAAVEAYPRVADIDDIAEVRVRTCSFAINVMADTPYKWRPTNRETADHSMPYTVGVALMFGTVEAKHFDDEYLNDPRLLSLVSRIKCDPSQEADDRMPEAMLCDLEVITRAGGRLKTRVEYYAGHWRNFMSDSQLEDKFRSLAAGVLRRERTDALLRQIWNLENLSGVTEIFHLTQA